MIQSQECSKSKDQFIETMTTIRIEQGNQYQQEPNVFQVIHQSNQQQPIIMQVVSRDEIEIPLKNENKLQKERINQLQEENDQLHFKLQQLSDQAKEKQHYIDTYKQKYFDMEQSKQLLVSELEKLNMQLQKQVITPRMRNSDNENSQRNSQHQLELDKLRIMLNNKEEELNRMKDKYIELETNGLNVLQDKLKYLTKENELLKQQKSKPKQQNYQFA